MSAISLNQLKENVAAFYQAGIFDCDKQFSQIPAFKAPDDAFEIVSEKGPLLFGGRCDGCNVHAKLFHIYAGTFHLWRKNLFKGHIKSIKVFGQAPDAEQIKKYAQEK